uniref:Small ribosomal subunit protein uS19c n=1 Tax=Pedobesia claviformis TaxID=2364088 RepID=A0A386B0U2_9CHLO|nr:ribosomal protein S19 [Pedobesia claviformis]AYC65318.1 ribosomal protein S19 [Pedobesia claviformis]
MSRQFPFISQSLLKKIKFLNFNKRHQVVKTWSRSSTIVPIMIGHTIAIYTGREFIPIFITEQMIGHKLGEFALTRTFRGHIKFDKKIIRRKL